MMKKVYAAAILAIATASPASAAVFDFSYTGTGVTASGQLTTTDSTDPNGFFTVTGITGSRNGETITALLAPGGFGDNDNLFKPTFAFFTNSGLTYSAGGVSYNLFTTGNVCAGFTAEARSTSSFECATIINLSFSAAPAGTVPEPKTWAMLIGGFGAIGATLRRRRTSVRFA